jgi:hypothetical protein
MSPPPTLCCSLRSTASSCRTRALQCRAADFRCDALLTLHLLGCFACSLFDKDGNGYLDYRETLGLAAALQQINKLFTSIPIRCQDDIDYVPSTQVVAQLKLRGEPPAWRAAPLQ